MSGTYSNLIYHIVFSTKGRRQLITSAIEAELYQYIDGIVHNLEGKLLEINGVADHIHLLVKLKPKYSVSEVVRDIKANSSKWLNENAKYHKFAWQDGFGAFTVRTQREINSVFRF